MLTPYTLTEPIGETDTVALYRGLDAGRQVLMRVLVGRPSPAQVIKLEHELELGSMLPPKAAARPLALATVDGRVALVLEYFEGRPLAQFLARPPPLPILLKIGMGICAALADVHHTIVHRDLRPDHVLFDPDTNQVKLTGFGIASLLPSERQGLEPPPLLEGALAYISPEQTRRTNHPIDSRSDLYSLGVILYQLATATLPFHGRDLLDWVHCHIARPPVPPQQLVPAFRRACRS